MTVRPTLLAVAVAQSFLMTSVLAETADDLAAVEKITIVGHKEDPTKSTGSAYVVSEKELETFFAVFEKIQMVIDQVNGNEINKPIFEL